jgi:hypothetical protein
MKGQKLFIMIIAIDRDDIIQAAERERKIKKKNKSFPHLDYGRVVD